MKKLTEANLPAIGYVRLPTVLALFPVSAATWWNMVRDGKAPKPYKLGPRITAWKADDIRALLEA